MATIVFNGTTLWEDGADKTGVGPVGISVVGASPRYEVSPLPKSSAKIVKNLGVDGGRVFVAARYVVTSAQYTTLLNLYASFADVVGTLTLPPGQNFTNCLLVSWAPSRGVVGEVWDGSTFVTAYQVLIQSTWEIVR